MATKDELQAAIDELTGKVEQLATTITTEAAEIKAELVSVAGGDGVRGAAVDSLKAISARIDGLSALASALVTPGQGAPEGDTNTEGTET